MAGTSYNGLPANIAAPAAVNISSSTNASPIVVQTSASHGMKSGDVCDISNHLGNLNANGIWTITFVDATHFSLNGSTGSGVGTASGAVQPLTFTGNVSLNPVNGDPYDASTYIPGMSCLADRTAYLATKLGAWKTVSVTQLIVDSDVTPYVSWASNPASAVSTWTPIATGAPGGYPLFVPGAVSGDIFVCEFNGTCIPGANASLTFQKLGIMSGFSPSGSLPTYQKVAGSGIVLPAGAGAGNNTPFSLESWQLYGGSFGLNARFAIGIWQVGTTVNASLISDATLTVTQYRPTQWPQ